jgi:hypothetical protein
MAAAVDGPYRPTGRCWPCLSQRRCRCAIAENITRLSAVRRGCRRRHRPRPLICQVGWTCQARQGAVIEPTDGGRRIPARLAVAAVTHHRSPPLASSWKLPRPTRSATQVEPDASYPPNRDRPARGRVDSVTKPAGRRLRTPRLIDREPESPMKQRGQALARPSTCSLANRCLSIRGGTSPTPAEHGDQTVCARQRRASSITRTLRTCR